MHGVVVAQFLEGLVPFENSLGDPGPQVLGDGLLDIERDRLDRRGNRALGRFLLQVPAVDVPHEVLVVFLVGEVLPHRQEVAHAVVGLPRFVIGGRQTADAVMHLDLHAARIDDRLQVLHPAIDGGDPQLGVVLEDFDLGPSRPVLHEVERGAGSADRTADHLIVVHEGAGEVDDVAAFGIGHDGQRIEHAVAVGHRNRIGLGRTRAGQEANVATQYVQVVADLPEHPQHVVVEAQVHAADDVVAADTLGDRSQNDEFLFQVARLNENQQPLVVVPHLEEAIGRLHPLGHHVEFRLGMFSARSGGFDRREGRKRGMLGPSPLGHPETKGQDQRRHEKSASRFHRATPNCFYSLRVSPNRYAGPTYRLDGSD